MAAFRDIQCSQDVGKMAELRRFDGEFLVFGCAYLAYNKVRYRVSSKDHEIYDYVAKSAVNDIYPTPIMSLLKRCPVPSGREEDIKEGVKLQLAKEMQRKYPLDYFEALEVFAKAMPSDGAYDLLMDLRDQLEGLFDDAKLQLFEGIVQLAYEAKVLSKNSYEQMHTWLAKTRVQMEDDVIVKNAFERTLYGIGYEQENGELAYAFDAQKTTIAAQKTAYEQKQVLCTPIFAKTFWFGGFDEFTEIKADYLQNLHHILGNDYVNLIREIKALPSAINQDDFIAALAKIKATCPPEAVSAFISYGYRWNVLKKKQDNV